MDKRDISSLTLEALTAYITGELGQPKFRGAQVYSWLHEKQVERFEEMQNLPGTLRKTLDEKAAIAQVTTKRQLRSKLDGTQKFLFELADGNCVETVWMEYHHGASLCISTQVGCRMGCKFCASTLGGLVRNLTPGEMLGQIYEAQRRGGAKISTLVLMGIGEPLDNFDNVMTFLEILSSPQGQNLSLRHVSLSTCGLVEGIGELMEKKLGLTLSISLHAADNATRSAIMPINTKYNVESLMVACKKYFAATGRRISYEYALIDGVNDSYDHAAALVRLLGGQNCHVNLIPVNPVRERDTQRSTKEAVEKFAKILDQRGLNVTVRRELGSDIAAACGQLRRAERTTKTEQDTTAEQ